MRLMEYFIGYLCVSILQQGHLPKTFFVDQLLHIYLAVVAVDFFINHIFWPERR